LPFPFTVTDGVNSGIAEQKVSVGPNSSKLMLPVGAKPPLRWAVSKMGPPPRATGAEAVVVSTVVALATTTCSDGSLQAVLSGSLLASPL
jgi:hypothetical protein